MDLQRRLFVLLLLAAATHADSTNGAPDSARLSLAAELRVLQVAEKVAPSPLEQSTDAKGVVKKRESADPTTNTIAELSAAERMAAAELSAEEQAEPPPVSHGYEVYEIDAATAPSDEEIFTLKDKGLSKKEAALLRPADDDKAAHRWKGIRNSKHAHIHKQALNDAIRVRRPPRGPPPSGRYPPPRSASAPPPPPPPPPPTLPSGFRPMLPPPGFRPRPSSVPADIMQDVNAAYSHVSFRTRPSRPQLAVPSKYQPQVSLQVQSATLQVQDDDENIDDTQNDTGSLEIQNQAIVEVKLNETLSQRDTLNEAELKNVTETLEELEKAIKIAEEEARVRAREHAELKAKAKAAAQSKIREENAAKLKKAQEALAKAKSQIKKPVQLDTTTNPLSGNYSKTQVETQAPPPAETVSKEETDASNTTKERPQPEKGRRGRVLEAEISAAPDGSQANKRELENSNQVQSTAASHVDIHQVRVASQSLSQVQEQAHEESGHVQGYAVEVAKPVHYAVEVPVPRPVPVPVERPVPVPVEKEVPVPVRVPVERPVPVAVPVEREVPFPVAVPVPHPVPVPVRVPRPVPHYVEVHIPVRKPVPVAVHVPVRRPYPVKLRVPYAVPVDRPYPVHVKVPVDRPYPVYVHKPFPVHFQKHVPYTVEKHVPFEVKVPVDRPYPLHIPQPYPVTEYRPLPFTVERPYPVHVDRPYPVHVAVPVDRPYAVDEHHITLDSAFDAHYASHHLHQQHHQHYGSDEQVSHESQESSQTATAPPQAHDATSRNARAQGDVDVDVATDPAITYPPLDPAPVTEAANEGTVRP